MSESVWWSAILSRRNVRRNPKRNSFRSEDVSVDVNCADMTLGSVISSPFQPVGHGEAWAVLSL
jgi:hypothetical protein